MIFIRCINGERVEGDVGARGIKEWMNGMEVEDEKQNNTLVNRNRPFAK
jgi:hypothetical protein